MVSHAKSHGRVCWLDGFVTHWSKWYSHTSFASTICHVLPILKLCSGGQLAQVRWGTVGDMVRGVEGVTVFESVWLVTCWLVPGQCVATVHCVHCPLSSSSMQPPATEPVPTHRLQPANCHPPLTLITIPTALVYRLFSVFPSITMSNRMYKSRRIFNCKCISILILILYFIYSPYKSKSSSNKIQVENFVGRAYQTKPTKNSSVKLCCETNSSYHNIRTQIKCVKHVKSF